MAVRVGLWRKLSIKELMLLNYGTFELWRTLESPLDSKTIKPVNSKENQPWTFTGRTNAEAEAPLPWPPDVKSWLIGKDPDAGEDWGQEMKGTTEDETVGWHHWHKFEQTGRWWRTGKPGVLQSMGSQRVGQDLATEQQQHRTSRTHLSRKFPALQSRCNNCLGY